jgi:hypothetical protein
MDLDVLEDVVIVAQEPIVSSVHQATKHPLLSKSSSKSMSDLAGSSRLGVSTGLKTIPALSYSSGLSVPKPVQQDRWASMDDDDSDDEGGDATETLNGGTSLPVPDSGHVHSLGHVSGPESATATTTKTTLPADPISLTLDPCLDELAETLKKFMDHSKVYGSGWATALRLKIKGSLQGAGQKTRGKIQLRLDDIGLVPENYIERMAFVPTPSVTGHSKFPTLK